MMLINNVRMLIEMQWGMLTGFQNTLFLMHCRSILLRPWRNSGFATLHMCAIHNGIYIFLNSHSFSYANCYFLTKDFSLFHFWKKIKPRKYLVKSQVGRRLQKGFSLYVQHDCIQ